MDPSPSSPTGSDGTPAAGVPERAASPVPPPAGAPPPDAASAPVRRLGPLPLTRRTAIVAALVMAVLLLVGIAWAGTGYRYDPYVEQPASVTGKARPLRGS